MFNVVLVLYGKFIYNCGLSTCLFNYTGPYPEPYLIVSSRKEIAVVDLTSVYKKSIIQGRWRIKSHAIDPFQKLLYFQDGVNIYRSNLDGSNTSLVPNNFDTWTFTFDWLGKRLFLVESRNKTIITVRSVDFQYSTPLVNHKEDILSLVVDPSYGYKLLFCLVNFIIFIIVNFTVDKEIRIPISGKTSIIEQC